MYIEKIIVSWLAFCFLIVSPGILWAEADYDGLDIIEYKVERPVVPSSTKNGYQFKLRIAELADQIITGANEPIAGELKLCVATFVNLNMVYEASGFGRYIGEQLSHEMQQAGVEVYDIRMMPTMQISKGHGEFVLSREMGELNYLHHVDALLVGTYSVADSQVFVSARLLANGTGQLLSSANLVFPLDSVTSDFLKDASSPPPAATTVAVKPWSKEGR